MLTLLLLVTMASSYPSARITGPIDQAVVQRFLDRQTADVQACLTGPSPVRLAVGPDCHIVSVQGEECLRERWAGLALDTGYCGCGMAFIELELTPEAP